jgi:hypothetical protein
MKITAPAVQHNPIQREQNTPKRKRKKENARQKYLPRHHTHEQENREQ